MSLDAAESAAVPSPSKSASFSPPDYYFARSLYRLEAYHTDAAKVNCAGPLPLTAVLMRLPLIAKEFH